MRGTCAKEVSFDLNDGIISNVKFSFGCSGNLTGISAMAEGMKAEDVIAKLSGIQCGNRGTSCPDQFAKAVAAAISEYSELA
ncbi:MAG: TIGR03905 family TSCPD domain-containing protein [Clostridiales bacterium]|jgi:uncharacterized protein (TIGR03905 family)|nr:TIGR03905 family TSCPD domain-containing protein [Clostridiales bacterium]